MWGRLPCKKIYTHNCGGPFSIEMLRISTRTFMFVRELEIPLRGMRWNYVHRLH